jgi:hypothetical protein
VYILPDGGRDWQGEVRRVGPDLAAVLLGAEIADLKDVDYRNTLAICTLIELLCERGLIGRAEFARRAQALDLAAGRPEPDLP